MRFVLLCLLSSTSIFVINAQCLEITSIFVNSCGSPEGVNEMFTFETGANDIPVNDVSVIWSNPSNSFLNWCQDAGTAASTASLNSTIVNSCGFLLEPTGGNLPANATVLAVTSTDFDLNANSFENLSDTLYIIYQCSGNTAGHFVNSGAVERDLIVSTTGTCVSSDTVTYFANLLSGSNGATVLFDAAGNDTYVNNGCNAPVISLSAGWSFTDKICNDYGDLNLNTLLAPNATQPGVFTGPNITNDSIFNPAGLMGAQSITYTVLGTGACTGSLDSTITFNVVMPQMAMETVQGCDSVFVNGQWYNSSTTFNGSIPVGNPFYCDSTVAYNIVIDSAIKDSVYLFACESIDVEGITYSADTVLRDTVSGAGGTGSGVFCNELFISEYVEGSSNNKAIEIYNGTGVPVNLNNYTLERYTNGSNTASLPILSLSGVIADGDVFVIYNPSSTTAISNVGDLADGYINHNGNDAYALLNNGVIIDIFGNIGCDPGAEWNDLGNGTQDNSYVRQASYTDGITTDPSNSPCDFPSLNTMNWISADAVDDFSNLGVHNSDCSSGQASSCDTIFITNIDIANPPVTSNINLCTNTISNAGVVIDTLQGASGCDSLITTTTTTFVAVTVNDVNPTSECDSVIYNGTTYFASTTLSDTTLSTLGCDSIVNNVNITVQNCTPCTYQTYLADGYEYSGAIPGLIPGSTFQTTPQTFCPLTGNNSFYANFQDGYSGEFYNRTLDVCPNAEFRFSFWTKDCFGSNNDVDVTITDANNTILWGPVNVVNPTGSAWQQIVSTPFTPTTGTIILSMSTNLPGTGGNDMTIDDLLLEICVNSNLFNTTNDVSLCNYTEINLYDSLISANLGTTGSWAPAALSNGFLGTFNPNLNSDGLYAYTLAGLNNCPDTTNNVNVLFNEISNTTPITICAGDSIFAAGAWQTMAGSFNDTIATANGCDSIETTLVSIDNNCPIECDFDLGPDVELCQGDSVVLDAGLGFDTYEWQDGSMNQTFTANTTGEYYATISQIDLTNNIIQNGDFEQGNTGFTTDYIVGTGGPFGQLSNAGTYAISTSPSNVHNFFFSCPDHTSGVGNMMVVNGSDQPNTNVWCQNITVTANTDYIFSAWAMSLENTNLANVSTLHFLIDGVEIGNDFSPSFTGCEWGQFFTTWNSGGSTNIEICIESDVVNGNNDYAIDDIFFSPICTFSDTVQVTVNPIPAPNLGGDQTICSGDSAVLDVTTTNATYLWQDGSTTSATFTANSTGTYFVDVTVDGCTGRDSVDIDVNPILTETVNARICDGDLYTLPDNSQVGLGGIYIDTLNIGGCDSIVTTNLQVLIAQNENLPTVTICEGESTNIFGNNETLGGNYTNTIQSLDLLGCDSLIQSIELVVIDTSTTNVLETICEGETFILPSGTAVNSTGIYNDTSTVNGCDNITILDLTVSTAPTANAGIDTTITIGETLQISAEDAGSTAIYDWLSDFGDTDFGQTILVSPTLTTEYYLTVSNNGCTAADSIRVVVLEENIQILIPTAFSPNGDGVNPIFQVVNPEEFSDIELRVYNRWGELVHIGFGDSNGWDGTYKGKNQPIGTYLYYVKAKPITSTGGAEMKITGNVALIR